MTAYTDSYGFNKNQAAAGAYSENRLGFLRVELDFEKIVAARAAAGVTALAATDTLQVLQIPAGSLMLAAGLDVIEAETVNTTATLDLGCTGGSPVAANAFANDVALNALGPASTGLAAPVLFSSADTLDILINTDDPTNARVVVWAMFINANMD